MGARVVYKAHVQREDGKVETLTPQGAPGWVLLCEVEEAVADILRRIDGLDIIKVVVTEERIVREYNGPAKKARGTTPL